MVLTVMISYKHQILDQDKYYFSPDEYFFIKIRLNAANLDGLGMSSENENSTQVSDINVHMGEAEGVWDILGGLGRTNYR